MPAALAPPRMSLIPSSRTTWLSPLRWSTSRSSRATALSPLRGECVTTLFPAIPSLTTDGAAAWYRVSSRLDSTSGQRRLALPVDPLPSVIESPSATTVRGVLSARVLTAVTKNQCDVVVGYEVALL